MKALVVGDFHGTFSNKFLKIIKKDKIDVVVSNGDYLPFSYRKLWFKHCFGKDVDLWEFIGKRRYNKLIKKDLVAGERVLKVLDNLPVRVFTTLGNVDYPMPDDISDVKRYRDSTKRAKEFTSFFKKYKNVKRVDYKALRFGDFVFVGARTHSAPGDPKSKAFKKHKKILDKLFSKFRKENKDKKVIFVSHNVPYNTKLDKISMKAHELVRGKHYGSKLVRKTIDKWKPGVHIGGHIHEGRGKQNLKGTLCINPGSAHEGHAVVLEIPDKGKIKTRFVR